MARKPWKYWHPKMTRHRRGFVFAFSAHWYLRPQPDRWRGWDATVGLGLWSFHLGYRLPPREPADA
jgi:hypothetical protein